MSNYGIHSVACQAHAMICAVENLRDEDGQTPFTFRIEVQTTMRLLSMADSYLDFENDPQMAHDVCQCYISTMERIMEHVRAGNLQRAQAIANASLEERVISPEQYIQLVRATEGR